MDPERLFSFRWPVGTGNDAAEHMTLVEFRLEDTPDGTRLTVVESGFEGLPAARRAEAFRSNSEGWTIQTENIRQYVET